MSPAYEENIMKKAKVKNSPASYVWGVKNPNRVANKYKIYGVVKKKCRKNS